MLLLLTTDHLKPHEHRSDHCCSQAIHEVPPSIHRLLAEHEEESFRFLTDLIFGLRLPLFNHLIRFYAQISAVPR